MKNPAFCLYEIKGADQMCDDRADDHHLCFRYIYISPLYDFFRCTRIRNDPWPEYLLELVYLQYNILFPSFGIHKIQVFLVYR